MTTLLNEFVGDAHDCSRRHGEPAECVEAIAPLMRRLLAHTVSFLEPRHLLSDSDHYARNAILVSPDESLSLYALVWLPGQWTPVHDHGSWGVVGVVQGMLHERNYIRMDRDRGADNGIELVRGGVILLAPGTVTSFVPNPDHIHVTGVPADGALTVSLHLYGRNMNNFCVYDLPSRSRKRVNVAHNES
jgi:predicted metal-dependent enzyme (double-stranded beta helix superfamily)